MGAATSYGALPPLWLLPELRCAARLHSRDLDVREAVNIDLKRPQERVADDRSPRYRWFDDVDRDRRHGDSAQVLE